MKFLLVVLVALAGVWLWRASRPSDDQLPHPKTKAEPPPLDMVRCAWCAVHVPSADGVQGKRGWYCCVDHMQRAEP